MLALEILILMYLINSICFFIVLIVLKINSLRLLEMKVTLENLIKMKITMKDIQLLKMLLIPLFSTKVLIDLNNLKIDKK